MKPAEAFGVVLRSVGILLLVSTVNLLVMGMAQPGLLFLMIPMLVLGIWLLRGAPAIVNFAYPNSERADDGRSTPTDGFE